MILHRRLQAHLTRAGLSWEDVPTAAAWQLLLGMVSDSFRDAEKEQFRLERALDVHVREIQAVYADLAWERDNVNSLLSVLDQGLAILDPDGQMLVLNARGEQLLGASEKDLQGAGLARRLGRPLVPGKARTAEFELLVEPVWRDGQVSSLFVVFGPPRLAAREAPPSVEAGPEFFIRESLELGLPPSTLLLIYRDVPRQLRGPLPRLQALVAALQTGLTDFTLEVRVLERAGSRLVLRLDLSVPREVPAQGPWVAAGLAGGGETVAGLTTRWATLAFEAVPDDHPPLAGVRLGLVGEATLERAVVEEELHRAGAWVRAGTAPPAGLLPPDLLLWHGPSGGPGLQLAPQRWRAASLRELVDRVLGGLRPAEKTLEEKPPAAPLRVLVAEDELVSRMVAEEFVESQGYQCLVAEDGAEAWALYQQHGADVVITDLLMPGMSGLDLCRQVRAGPGPQPFIIVLSAAGETELVESALEAGADDFLAKPLDYEQLGERLRALPARVSP